MPADVLVSEGGDDFVLSLQEVQDLGAVVDPNRKVMMFPDGLKMKYSFSYGRELLADCDADV